MKRKERLSAQSNGRDGGSSGGGVTFSFSYKELIATGLVGALLALLASWWELSGVLIGTLSPMVSGVIMAIVKAYLRIANLREANLSEADLSEADLRAADLRGADLSIANLSKAPLYRANLSGTDLRGTDLKGANLSEADLSEAALIKADLRGANLTFANLNDSELTDAHLGGAEGITNEELEQQAETLEGTTMPNGQKYEDWLKKREGHGVDG